MRTMKYTINGLSMGVFDLKGVQCSLMRRFGEQRGFVRHGIIGNEILVEERIIDLVDARGGVQIGIPLGLAREEGLARAAAEEGPEVLVEIGVELKCGLLDFIQKLNRKGRW